MWLACKKLLADGVIEKMPLTAQVAAVSVGIFEDEAVLDLNYAEDSHAIVDSQRTLAQQLADWGADVIVGTHPHVLQDAQWLTAADGRRSFVAYSLGNFLSTQSRPDQLVGAILTLQLQQPTQPNDSVQCEVLAPQLHPTVTHYDAGKANVRTYLLRDYTCLLYTSPSPRDS